MVVFLHTNNSISEKNKKFRHQKKIWQVVLLVILLLRLLFTELYSGISFVLA